MDASIQKISHKEIQQTDRKHECDILDRAGNDSLHQILGPALRKRVSMLKFFYHFMASFSTFHWIEDA